MTQSNWSLSSHARSFEIRNWRDRKHEAFLRAFNFRESRYEAVQRLRSNAVQLRGGGVKGALENERRRIREARDFRIFHPSSVDKAINSRSLCSSSSKVNYKQRIYLSPSKFSILSDDKTHFQMRNLVVRLLELIESRVVDLFFVGE